MDVRWTEIRVVHSADTDEPDGGTGLRVVAPDRNPAGRAAGDLLTLAARRQRYDDFGLTGGVHDTIGLIERVESMRGPGLPLAPTAMASMNDQWRSNQTISDLPARASAFHIQLHRGVLAFDFALRMTDVQFVRNRPSARQIYLSKRTQRPAVGASESGHNRTCASVTAGARRQRSLPRFSPNLPGILGVAFGRVIFASNVRDVDPRRW